MKTLAFGNIGSCFLYVCSKHPPNEAEWNEYIDFLKIRLEPGMRPTSIVLSDGAGPGASQRQQLNEVISPYVDYLRVAVVTTSPVARGIVTALSWFSPVYRAFSPKDIDDALSFLDIGDPDAPLIKSLLTELKDQLVRP
jgi:hypothetical protein